MNTETTTETIQAEHRFTDTEMANLGRQMAAQCGTRTQLENQLASIKKDYGAQIQKADLDCDTTASKLRDGFEMRPVSALVQYNCPDKGRKCYFYALPSFEGDWCFPGNLIREEPMTEPDFQRLLPLGAANSDSTSGPPAELPPDWGRERHPEIGDSEREFQEAKSVVETAGGAIGTPVGDVLDGAVAAIKHGRVSIDFNAKDNGAKKLAKWRKAARSQEWSEPAINLIDEQARIAGSSGGTAALMDVLRAHSISTQQRAEELAAVFSVTEEAK